MAPAWKGAEEAPAQAPGRTRLLLASISPSGRSPGCSLGLPLLTCPPRQGCSMISAGDEQPRRTSPSPWPCRDGWQGQAKLPAPRASHSGVPSPRHPRSACSSLPRQCGAARLRGAGLYLQRHKRPLPPSLHRATEMAAPRWGARRWERREGLTHDAEAPGAQETGWAGSRAEGLRREQGRRRSSALCSSPGAGSCSWNTGRDITPL